MQASHDFAEIRKHGTGKSSVLAQHFIVSFKPGEITPERALQLGQEICEQFLKGEYQYFMTCHIDKEHTHLHCVFNNTNCIDGRTFETHENRRTTKQDRSFQKLINITDEVCRQHHLSVIEHPEMGKGKNHWEWDMSRQGLSWKAKLKYAIDQVVKVSENFEDFLAKCADYGVLVEYNPDHKIDLKFMLAEHKEHNPNARFTRARTLGYLYETEQIKKRIAQFVGGMSYTPRARVRAVEQTPQNKFVQDAIDRGNMKIASIAQNIIAQYGIAPENLRAEVTALFARSAALSGEVSRIKSQIEGVEFEREIIGEYKKLKPIYDEYVSLKGRKQEKYERENFGKLTDFNSAKRDILEMYPDGHIPSAEAMKRRLADLKQQLKEKSSEHTAVHQAYKELFQAQRDIEAYLRQYEPQVQEQSRNQRKRKKDVLE